VRNPAFVSLIAGSVRNAPWIKTGCGSAPESSITTHYGTDYRPFLGRLPIRNGGAGNLDKIPPLILRERLATTIL
jgi:hypothetical protein